MALEIIDERWNPSDEELLGLSQKGAVNPWTSRPTAEAKRAKAKTELIRESGRQRLAESFQSLGLTKEEAAVAAGGEPQTAAEEFWDAIKKQG